MARTRTATLRGATEDAVAERPLTADLVGTKAAVTLQADRPLTRSLTRQIVASALDMDESALDSADDGALDAALARLRKIAQTIERLAATAATDELTGAQRRGPGMLALQREIDRETRRRTNGVVVAFIDVDGLKRVNDTEGHAAGDDLLREVVRLIRTRIRSYDLLFRYGGDEFVIVLLEVSLAQGDQIVEDIRRDIVERTGGSVSAGTASIVPGDTAVDAVARADAQLYRERAQVRRAS